VLPPTIYARAPIDVAQTDNCLLDATRHQHPTQTGGLGSTHHENPHPSVRGSRYYRTSAVSISRRMDVVINRDGQIEYLAYLDLAVNDSGALAQSSDQHTECEHRWESDPEAIATSKHPNRGNGHGACHATQTHRPCHHPVEHRDPTWDPGGSRRRLPEQPTTPTGGRVVLHATNLGADVAHVPRNGITDQVGKGERPFRCVNFHQHSNVHVVVEHELAPPVPIGVHFRVVSSSRPTDATKKAVDGCGDSRRRRASVTSTLIKPWIGAIRRPARNARVTNRRLAGNGLTSTRRAGLDSFTAIPPLRPCRSTT
jgi:hypothetical protein